MDGAKYNTDTLAALILKLCWEILINQKFYKIEKTNKLMEMQINPQEIMKRLIKLQNDVDFIKKNIIDIDYFLDEDDKEALRLAEEEFRERKLVSLEDIEKLRKKNV